MAVIVVVCIACVEQHVHLRLMLCCISEVGAGGRVDEGVCGG